MSIKFANERGSYEECFSWNDLNKRKVSFAQKIVLFNAQYGNCNLIHFWFAKFMKTAKTFINWLQNLLNLEQLKMT